ncbi:porin family protein [Pontibacter fetidus]|uniref:PorT family protein n=1 Tax=Pontibacter fetidus TaxID=2700082 RepID=A0A6B2H7S4_9BACT|nr:porin family protein [Pontibacter fetidus]NDK56557.1 PorT family protein [Pontibacter fetidus]
MKMRNLVLLLLICLIGTYTATAQTISVGPRLGVNFGIQKVSSSDEDFAKDWNEEVVSAPGLLIGGVVAIKFNETFSVQPELLFTQKGYKFEDDARTVTGKYDYLELPLLAKISFGAPDFQGFITAGPTFGYWASGKDVYKSGGIEFSEDLEENGFVEKRSEVGGSIGAGFAAALGAGSLNFDLRYGAGFTSVYESDDDDKLRNSGFNVSVAYLFGL